MSIIFCSYMSLTGYLPFSSTESQTIVCGKIKKRPSCLCVISGCACMDFLYAIIKPSEYKDINKPIVVTEHAQSPCLQHQKLHSPHQSSWFNFNSVPLLIVCKMCPFGNRSNWNLALYKAASALASLLTVCNAHFI